MSDIPPSLLNISIGEDQSVSPCKLPEIIGDLYPIPLGLIRNAFLQLPEPLRDPSSSRSLVSQMLGGVYPKDSNFHQIWQLIKEKKVENLLDLALNTGRVEFLSRLDTFYDLPDQHRRYLELKTAETKKDELDNNATLGKKTVQKVKNSEEERRRDMFEMSKQFDPMDIANSIVSLWFQKNFVNQGATLKATSLRESKKEHLSEDDSFLDQPTGAFGTAFYVKYGGKPCVITAGHCILDGTGEVNENWVKHIRFVFGFRLDGYADSYPLDWKIPPEQVIKAKKIVAASCSYSKKGIQDFAIVELESAPPPPYKPLTLDIRVPKKGDNVCTFGHPEGLPLKFTRGGQVLGVNKNVFFINLDTFEGNSGSPIFIEDSESGEIFIAGMLIGGSDDRDERGSHLGPPGTKPEDNEWAFSLSYPSFLSLLAKLSIGNPFK